MCYRFGGNLRINIKRYLKKRVIHVNHAFLQVDIAPAEAGCFAHPEFRSDHDREDRIPMPALRGVLQILTNLHLITRVPLTQATLPLQSGILLNLTKIGPVLSAVMMAVEPILVKLIIFVL